MVHYHFSRHFHFISFPNQRCVNRCPMPATSILKMIRNFRLVEARYSTNEIFFIKCSISYLTMSSIVIFHSEDVFSTFWNTWVRSNTKEINMNDMNVKSWSWIRDYESFETVNQNESKTNGTNFSEMSKMKNWKIVHDED